MVEKHKIDAVQKKANQYLYLHMHATMTASAPDLTHNKRIESIDWLRGFVMIIMALDHVRDYFHADAFFFNPLDLEKTSAALFFTRWITHLCAPVFVFLAGTSAYLVGQRKGKKYVSGFLLKRGLWLLVLEFTVINFGWFFNIHFSFFACTVIWALGMAMIALAAAVHLPFRYLLILGIAIIVGHNVLDLVPYEHHLLWSILHQPDGFHAGDKLIFMAYPILPWCGVMFAGYCLGALYTSSVTPEQRRRTLMRLGWGAILLFVVVRTVNIYGDPEPWSTQNNGLYTVLSFLNVTKYPPSLLYIAITLGPSFLLLAWAEGFQGKAHAVVVRLGRVPMFYYILHIYVIHLLALVAAVATGFTPSDMVFSIWVTEADQLDGYGFTLGVVYAIWVVLVAALLPICLWYDRFKSQHRTWWWLSYL